MHFQMTVGEGDLKAHDDARVEDASYERRAVTIVILSYTYLASIAGATTNIVREPLRHSIIIR